MVLLSTSLAYPSNQNNASKVGLKTRLYDEDVVGGYELWLLRLLRRRRLRAKS